jgi:hypothetical membrane protein
MKFPELRCIIPLTVIMPIFFATMWILSATIDGKWTFGVNSLSDMGISENAVCAFLFNFGCVVAGLGGFVISLATFAYGKKTLRFGGIVAAVSFLFLSLVGVFTLNTFEAHSFVASTFGVLLFISIVLSSVSDYKVSWYLYFDIPFIVTVAAVVLTQPFPLWEAITVIGSLIWIMVLGYKMHVHDDRLFGDEPRLRL